MVKVIGVEPFVGLRAKLASDKDPAILTPRLWAPLRTSSPFLREQILNFNARLLVRKLTAYLHDLPEQRCVILDNPYAWMAAHELQKDGFRFIVRLTDWMPGQIPSPDRETNFRMLRQALRHCDAVIATSSPIARSVRLLTGRAATVITNGVDQAILRPRGTADRTANRAIYYGALDVRIDLSALRVMADLCPEMDFDVYTPTVLTAHPGLPANVHLKEAIPYVELPEVLSRYVFGFLPFAPSVSNHGRFPMKLFEMLGSGVQIVTPPLGSLAGHYGKPGLHIANGFDGQALAETLGRVHRSWMEATDDARETMRRNMHDAAATQTWERKVAEILQVCRFPS